MTTSASAQGLACSGPQQAMLEIDLLFGRNIGMELGVSEAHWSDFVAQEITPRFPQGLSIDDAMGQWRDPERNVIRAGAKQRGQAHRSRRRRSKGEDRRHCRLLQTALSATIGRGVMRPACASF
jgi:hypothetical protein